MSRSVYIGFDPREIDAFIVARRSLTCRATGPINVHGLDLRRLIKQGLYWRETVVKDGSMWDVVSDAPMSTEFAISRFLVPHLTKIRSFEGKAGWALFMDADVMVRGNVSRLFDLADDTKAVMCVKHQFTPPEGVKMDGQIQTQYARKNWSSVMLINCDHPSNDALTVDMVNELPGRDLHRFCWLKDDEIGSLPVTWNWLVGHSDPGVIGPQIVHYTDGIPRMPGYTDAPFADEWRAELEAAVA